MGFYSSGMCSGDADDARPRTTLQVASKSLVILAKVPGRRVLFLILLMNAEINGQTD